MARRSRSSSARGEDEHPTPPFRAETAADAVVDAATPVFENKSQPLALDPTFLPSGERSFSSIALQAFFLGFVLATCLISTVWLVVHNKPVWRLPSFFACLSVFHFLEYWTTAHFNPPAARASSFLLFNNGTAYNVAHSLATLEIILSTFLPTYQSFAVNRYTIAAGIVLVVVGQTARSVAMAHLGTNFNHLIQRVRREGHVLVTTGIYRWLRHPSYFGFYCWAVGTQVLVGNKLCLIGYVLTLWHFFSRRIKGEEKVLIAFFGTEYETYREKTRTGIPFIR